MIGLAKIGPVQRIDVTKSGKELCTEYFRTCTILQPDSAIGDTSPHRMTKLFGEKAEYYNNHFVVQTDWCGLKCWYCYVDNITHGMSISAQDLVQEYIKFKLIRPNIHVLHLMGGMPGIYCDEWQDIRKELDRNNLYNDILLSNITLVENTFAKVKPWLNIPPRTLIDVCIKGTNFSNFKLNTGTNLFGQAMGELQHYIGHRQVFYSAIEYDKDIGLLIDWLGAENIDLLKVKMYEVTKWRNDKDKHE